MKVFTPLHIENAESASPRSLITTPEGGVVNVRRCKTKKNITKRNKKTRKTLDKTIGRGGMVEEEEEITEFPEDEFRFDQGSRSRSMVGSGGFGTVHKTFSPGGTNYATKIIRVGEEIEEFIRINTDAIKKELTGKPESVIKGVILKIKQKKIDEKIKVIKNEASILRKLQSHCSKYILCFKGVFKKEDPLEYYLISQGLFDYVMLNVFILNDRNYGKSIEDIFSFMEHRDQTRHNISIAGSRLFNKDKDKDKKTPPLLSIAHIALTSNLCNGLSLIHHLGIAHRDIKPENIMIHPQTYEIKYIDFGLSCDFSSSFDDYCKKPDLGTPDTLDPLLLLLKRSPEGLNRSRLFQADLWSLGIVIFFCIAKKYPIDLLQLSDMDENFGSHIKNNYNNEDFWNRKDILNVFEITKQFHRKVESLNNQTHIKGAKKYSSATLEELLSLDPTKRTLHIVDEHPPSKESKKKTATPIVHTVASVSAAIESIESKESKETKETKKRKSKPKTFAPIPEGGESFRAV